MVNMVITEPIRAAIFTFEIGNAMNVFDFKTIY